MSKKLPYVFLISLIGLSTNLIANEDFSKAHESHHQRLLSASGTISIFQPFTGRVTGNKVRLRVQPNLEGHILRETHYGEMFAVIGEEPDFFIVQAPKGVKGYVFRTFVLDDTIEGERVNVRLQPDTDAPIIGRLNAGDKIKSAVCTQNPKWLEIDLPSSSHFYIAKEFVDNIGPVELLAQMETRRNEAQCRMNSAFAFVKAQMQKPFEEFDLDEVNKKFDALLTAYNDFPDIEEKVHEAIKVVQDAYIQKKIAFLETKSERGIASRKPEPLPEFFNTKEPSSQEHFIVKTEPSEMTDKMMIWQPIEESLYHLWVAVHGSKSIDDFYHEESVNATVLTGIIEPYNRPVKNRPGDFILRCDNLPVAFLYSTKINLQDKIGQQVSISVLPRPNNNFAFPAYYVLSVN